eukprot:SAG31_NODE_44581_length_262_cov_0.638037_1_plen_21_part_10
MRVAARARRGARASSDRAVVV